jgi:hypothetical protein
MAHLKKNLFAALAAWLVACGGSAMQPPTSNGLEGSCDVRSREQECQDIAGIPSEEDLNGLAGKCVAVSQGTWSAYYPGGAGGLVHTREDLKAVCASTYVAP